MRNRLIELLKQRSCVYIPCDGDCGDCKNIEMFDEDIEQIADHLIANDVTIREHGKWIKTCVPNVYQCTNCKRPTQMDMLCDSEVLRAFCPNCGADMRKEQNNDGE